MKLFVVGDIHGRFSQFSTLLNNWSQKYKNEEIVVIQVGDFGLFPHMHGINEVVDFYGNTKKFDQWRTKVPKNVTVYIAPGNHENWIFINEVSEFFGKVPVALQPRLYLCPRGTILNFNDKNFLFMGGADSIDKCSRTLGIDWWPEELITQRDIYDLPDERVDVVIAHTVPQAVIKNKFHGDFFCNDPSTFALDTIISKYRPTHFYAGHWHFYMKEMFDGCLYTIMSNIESSYKWWEEIKF